MQDIAADWINMKKVSNIITILRMIFTIALNFYILINFGSVLVPFLLTLLIYFTDIIDGKIARKFVAATNFGAILDFLADVFYIVISYVVLCWYHILPWVGLGLILFKSTEFIITSLVLRAYSPEKHILIFDYLGKTVAIIFYAIPIAAYLAFHYIEITYLQTVEPMLCIMIIRALISSIYRIRLCIKLKKWSNYNQTKISENKKSWEAIQKQV